jgi:hypothetical protein
MTPLFLLGALRREYLLPQLHPLSLSMREHLLWIAHYVRHNLTHASAESFECEHLLPVAD